MEWKQVNRWYMQSTEGYRISQAFTECALPFVAWAPGAKTETPALGYFDTAAKAMQICEEHFKNQRSAK